MAFHASRSGQSLLEVLIAIAIGAVLFIGAAVLIAPTLQITKATSQAQVGAALGDELLNNVRVFSEANWQNIANLSTSSASQYYLITSSSPYTATSGIQSVSISTTTYTRYFSLSSMYRDGNGNATTSASGTAYDPSTMQVSVTYNWTRGATSTITEYLTRNRTQVATQSDWSGGSGWNGPATTTNNRFSASTNMSYNTPGSASVQLPAYPYPNGYLYRRAITASTSFIAPSGTALSNFPMLVSGTYSYLAASSSGGYLQNPNGYDIIFTSDASGTNQLAYERESYSSSTGAVNYWVNVPTLSSSSNAIYMFYDATTTTDQSNSTGTWNSNYTGVWHLGNGTALNVNDSTGLVGTTNDGATATTGKIGGGAGFNGTSQYIDASATVNYSGLTVEAWFNSSNLSNGFNPRLVANSHTDIDNKGFQLMFNNGGGSGFFDVGNGTANGSSSWTQALASNTWYDYVGTYNGANTRAYLNGSPLGSVGSITGAIATSGVDINFGRNGAYTSDYFIGAMDEVRISNVARSSDWISTEYNNQNSPSAFYTVGTSTTNSVSSVTGYISSSSAQHWAWNDSLGWIDFYNSNNVTVTASQLTGYASSTAGDVSLDCATTRKGSICGSSNYKVSNDGYGNLSGWAWNDTVGWISFCGGNSTSTCPGTISYQTTIDSGGNFQGWAWNDAVGWIDFNCDNTAGCGTSSYEVKTTWIPTSSSTLASLDSATFDTGVASGSQFNSILWQGTQALGSTVQFQFAVSNSSSGPWSFVGTDGTSNTYFTPSGPGASVSLGYSAFNNYRYFRYRLYILGTSVTSQVNAVVVNWSP